MRSFLALAALLVTLPLAAQPTRQELLEEPRYASDDAKPTYGKVSAADFEKSLVIKPVTIDDYGTPIRALEIGLPKGHNARHTIVTAAVPRVKAGSHALEANAFRVDLDNETSVLRLRYLNQGEETRVPTAVAGSAIIRYPLGVTTHSVKATDKGTWDKYGIEIDGPIVRFDHLRLTSGRWLGDPKLMRIYDASGRRLETAGEWMGEDERMFVGAYGKVARVDFDVPGELAAARVDYEIDPQKPASAKVKVRGLPSVPLTVLGDTVTYTEEQLRSYLEGFTGSLEEQLMRAVTENDPKAAQYLLALGAEQKSEGPMSPFILAATMNNEELAELLLEAGADVKSKDANGITPLIQIASACPSPKLVQKMIDRGADVNARPANGVTALAMATSMNCGQVVAVLKKAGAK